MNGLYSGIYGVLSCVELQNGIAGDELHSEVVMKGIVGRKVL